MESNPILEGKQHTFWQGKSVIITGVEFVQIMFSKIDKGEKVVGAFVDNMYVAFYCVPRTALIGVLNHKMSR